MVVMHELIDEACLLEGVGGFISDIKHVSHLKYLFGSLHVTLHYGHHVVMESTRADTINVESISSLHSNLVTELIDVCGLLLRSKAVEGEVADLLEVVGGELV